MAGLDKLCALPTRSLMRAFPVIEQSEINPDYTKPTQLLLLHPDLRTGYHEPHARHHR